MTGAGKASTADTSPPSSFPISISIACSSKMVCDRGIIKQFIRCKHIYDIYTADKIYTDSYKIIYGDRYTDIYDIRYTDIYDIRYTDIYDIKYTDINDIRYTDII